MTFVAMHLQEEIALDHRRRKNRLDSREPLIGLALQAARTQRQFCVGLLRAPAKQRPASAWKTTGPALRPAEAAPWQGALKRTKGARRSTRSTCQKPMNCPGPPAPHAEGMQGGNPAKLQHSTLYSLDAPPENSADVRRQLDALGLIRQPVRSHSRNDAFPAQWFVGWRNPVVLCITDSEQAQDCARSLARWLGTRKEFAQMSPRALPVPIPLFGDDNAIELWTPDGTTGASQ